MLLNRPDAAKRWLGGGAFGAQGKRGTDWEGAGRQEKVGCCCTCSCGGARGITSASNALICWSCPGVKESVEEPAPLVSGCGGNDWPEAPATLSSNLALMTAASFSPCLRNISSCSCSCFALMYERKSASCISSVFRATRSFLSLRVPDEVLLEDDEPDDLRRDRFHCLLSRGLERRLRSAPEDLYSPRYRLSLFESPLPMVAIKV